MVITKYIPKNCIQANMDSVNKPDALKQLIGLLLDAKKIESVGPALDQIIAREASESTGIGRGIAVPHARVPGIKQLTCALGRINDGIDFLAVDRKPVHLIFLICYPPAQQTTYLNFIATVVKLLADRTQLAAILKAESADDMFNILEKAAEKFVENHEEKARQLKADPKISSVDNAHADLILLARLQMHEEMLVSAKSGKKEIKNRIETIRSLVTPRILKHYDRLTKGRAPALVSVEGDTCQGCFMKLPTQFVQKVRNDTDHLHTCTNCSRYVYVV